MIGFEIVIWFLVCFCLWLGVEVVGSGGCGNGFQWWWLVVVGWVCCGLGVSVLEKIHVQKRE